MPAITDPAAMTFSNSKARVTADLMAHLYWTCKALIAEWNATSMSAKITNTTDLLSDGAATDGRNQITGINVTAIVTEAMAVVAHYEAGSNAVLNAIQIVKVNGGSAF
jgi:hypothetical protein